MDSGDLQFSRPLTNVALEYKNAQYIGDDVIPEVPVDDETFKFQTFGAARNFVVVNDSATQDGDVPVLTSKRSSTSGLTADRALRQPVNALVEHASGQLGYSEKIVAMEEVINSQDLANEQRVVTFLEDDANYVASRIITAGAGISPAKWDVVATGKPLADIQAMKDLLIVPPGAEVIGACSRDVWSAISLCDSVLDAVKYTMVGGLAEVAPIAAKLGLADIKIGGAWVHDGELAEDEADLSLSRMWGTGFYLIVRPAAGAGASRNRPSFAYNFRLRLKGSTRRVYEYEAPSRGGDGSTWIQVARNDVIKSVGKLYGAKIKACIT